MKKRLVSILSVCLVISLVFAFFSYIKVQDYKSKKDYMYENIIQSFYNYGLEIPQYKIDAVIDLISSKSVEDKAAVETWLIEIAADYGVAENSARLSQVYFRNFFGGLQTLLLDMVRTEKDYEKWKQICFELQDITAYLRTNVDQEDLKDETKAEEAWLKIMKDMKVKYSDTYLISSLSL